MYLSPTGTSTSASCVNSTTASLSWWEHIICEPMYHCTTLVLVTLEHKMRHAGYILVPTLFCIAYIRGHPLARQSDILAVSGSLILWLPNLEI